jgi:type IV pilus assembly protein PilE
MKKNYTTGFTLLEVMITIGIIGILSVIAYGAYSQNVIAAKRTDARSSLQTISTTLEKCKSLYGSYNSANCSIANGSTQASTEGYYDIKVESAASTFSLTAKPSSGSSQANDTDCTSLILNNLGQQSGTGADSTQCW